MTAALPLSPPHADLQAQVWSARARMLCAHVPNVMTMAMGFALAIGWVLQDQVDPRKVWAWFGVRAVVVVARVVQARFYKDAKNIGRPIWYRSFLALAFLDGLLWGAAWWWLVPNDRLDLTAITLAAILGVASLSAFIMHPDVRAASLHVLAILAPNVVYCLIRPDSYGLFGAMSLAAFTLFLLLETRRAQARLLDLLTLRFVHEQVLQERGQALEMAQHHSDAKSHFLASMSHEMRTPLHGILGLTRLLRDDEIRPVAQRRLELLERAGGHLLTVINDVLDVSKIEAGHVHIEHECFDLAALIDEVSGVSTVTAHRKGLPLNVRCDLPASHPVMGDAMRVRQILHNLLGNAIKFTERGSVTLSVRRGHEPDDISFVVEDTGVGIPESERAQIFDAFHQVDNALGMRHGGTGLGLSISRQLCQAMGGDLHCRSMRGVGSTFECTLRLPATDHVPAPQASAALLADAMAGQLGWPGAQIGGLVLLVEDNPINAMVAEAALRQIGVQVHIEGDGDKALDWLLDNRPDLVLMDCQMPGMDGFEVVRQLRQQELRRGLRRVPVIALTANVMATDRQRCLQAGMDDYLGKPFHREALYRLLIQHMGVGKNPWNEPLGHDAYASAA